MATKHNKPTHADKFAARKVFRNVAAALLIALAVVSVEIWALDRAPASVVAYDLGASSDVTRVIAIERDAPISIPFAVGL